MQRNCDNTCKRQGRAAKASNEHRMQQRSCSFIPQRQQQNTNSQHNRVKATHKNTTKKHTRAGGQHESTPKENARVRGQQANTPEKHNPPKTLHNNKKNKEKQRARDQYKPTDCK